MVKKAHGVWEEKKKELMQREEMVKVREDKVRKREEEWKKTQEKIVKKKKFSEMKASLEEENKEVE